MIFVIGESGGMRMAIAESFLENGAKVIIARTSKEKSYKCIIKLEGLSECSSMVESIVINLNDTDALSDMIKKAATLFIEKIIDILVISSGVINHTDFWNINEEEYNYIMNINVKGVFFMCQAMGKYMIENHVQGHILNVSSAYHLGLHGRFIRFQSGRSEASRKA